MIGLLGDSHCDLLQWLRHNNAGLRLLHRLSGAYPRNFQQVEREELARNMRRFDRNYWQFDMANDEASAWYLRHDPETMVRLRHISMIPAPVSDSHCDNYNYNILRIHDEGLRQFLHNPTPRTLDEVHRRTSHRMTVLDFLHNGDSNGIFNRQLYPEHNQIHEHLRAQNLHHLDNEADLHDLYLETIQEPQHPIGGSLRRRNRTNEYDPVPRAHMALQTHDSRMFSKMARELVGGGCCSSSARSGYSASALWNLTLNGATGRGIQNLINRFEDNDRIMEQFEQAYQRRFQEWQNYHRSNRNSPDLQSQLERILRDLFADLPTFF